MIKNTILTIVLLFALSGSVFGNDLNKIQWITEDYPPFNYVDDEGELRGFIIDILIEIWKKTGLKKTKKDIEVMPWARGMLMLKHDSNTCLFGMGINEVRKQEYIFVGSIPNVTQGLIAKRSKHYVFNSISDINDSFGDSRIGVVRGDIGQSSFLQQGGNPRRLHQVANGDLLILMLKLDRIDAIAFGDLVADKFMKKARIDNSDYEMVFTLYKGYSGYAFNKKADPKVIRKLQQAYDELYDDGTVMRIRNSYFVSQ
jgi:polar amino acid transport system substrate-binding protein